MAVDKQKVGLFAMEAIDVILDIFDNDENVEIGELMLVVEIKDPEHNRTLVLEHCTDPRAWVQFGLLEGAMEAARHGSKSG